MPMELRNRSNGAVPVQDDADFEPRGGRGGDGGGREGAEKSTAGPGNFASEEGRGCGQAQAGSGGSSSKKARARTFPESPAGRAAIYGFVLCLAAGIGVAHILETVEPVTTVRQGSPFTAEHAVRARGHMQSICDMGTRTVGGHANEVLAVDYILGKLRDVERMAAPGALVEIASHTSSGVSGVGELFV
jgi:hypothetical protein